jgi:ribosomal protein S18 acetylase RimI-like enzyme
LREVIEEAAKNGCDMKLSVLKANPAKSLYERLGFKVIGQDEYEYQVVRSAA